MRVIIQPEQQIQRINWLTNELEKYSSISEAELKRRLKEKSWSIIEVVKHMSIGHAAYQKKISQALKLPSKQLKVVDKLKCSTIPSYLIKRFPPNEGKIRLKMKTSKQFQPIILNEGQSMKDIFVELTDSLEELKSWVNTYRTQAISLKKFNSAIGPVVRFNIPEACEFILCHNERHFHQMGTILNGHG
ncbi:MAG: hypothetical protein ACI837_002119 [Crocinitomicaceae bacterium]|jgi:hypothetical protein